MARQLVALARTAETQLPLFAHTLPVTGASTATLARLGFAFPGTVDHPEDGPGWEWRLVRQPGGLPGSRPPL